MPEIIVKLGDNVVHKYFLYKDVVTVGRSPENEIVIENLAVSRKHITIRRADDRYILEDNQSANGTYVNGVRVNKTEIVDKDIISVGKHKLHFYDQQAAPTPPQEFAEKTMLVTHGPDVIPILRVVQGKQKGEFYSLDKKETRIGRASDNDIRLNDWFVSKHHAVVARRGMVYVIRDLASWRHTLVNGSIVEEQALRPGDKLQFGPKIVMELEIPTAEELEDLAGRVPVELAERVEFEPCQDESSPGTVDEEVAVAAEERSDPSEEDEEDLPHTSVWPIDSLLDAQSAIVGQAESIDPADGAPADPERAEGAVWSEQSQDEWNLDDGEPRQEEIALDRSEEEDFEFGADDESGPAEAWARLSHGDSDSWPSDEADGGSDAEALQSGDSSDERASDDDRETAAVGATPRPESSDPPEAQLWLKALANPSRIIRQQAQRTLKKLTGRHYDIE